MDGGTSTSSSSNDLPRSTWANLVPIKLQLAADNVSSPVRPQPLYILVPRQGFLSTVAAQAWPYFQHVLPNIPGQQGLRPWFDHQQLPLRGNIPIGALYDLLFSHSGSGDLPWELTIHFTGMPDALTNWHNGLPMATQFFHALKEACFICKGPDGSAAVMKMTGAAQDAMWSSVERGKADEYQAVLAALRVAPAERQGAAPAVPLRLLVRTAPGPDPGPGAAGWEDVFLSSRPVAATNPDGSWTTLGQVLEALLPGMRFLAPAAEAPRAGQGEGEAAGVAAEAAAGELVPGAAASEAPGSLRTPAGGAEAEAETSSAGGDAGAAPPAGPGPAAAAAAAAAEQLPVGPGPLQASTMSMSVFGSLPKLGPAALSGGCSCEAVVAGVLPPLLTPLAWLHSNLHAPDYFLYVVVRRSPQGGAASRQGS